MISTGRMVMIQKSTEKSWDISSKRADVSRSNANFAFENVTFCIPSFVEWSSQCDVCTLSPRCNDSDVTDDSVMTNKNDWRIKKKGYNILQHDTTVDAKASDKCKSNR